MTGWYIRPNGVATVLGRVKEQVVGAGGLAGEAKKFGADVKGAALAAQSPVIAKALGEFLEGYGKTIGQMGTKTGSCVTGAVKATKAYLAADLEMAAEAQRNAVNAPAPRIRR
ncbi:hypothetical protein DPM19_14590 [Actinomadura craniellae]|uniref:ESX-1 secretion-associated protein n=1 Tax=Actinomadura craniellae TaxID=2231787 RepID=A0A365H5A6_9ACTN|nr:DUF6507 family protein [Actinomadura craniellae]RAY14208.1 hypothetical protein DPM19_14590 [Actinomadura craniellae]